MKIDEVRKRLSEKFKLMDLDSQILEKKLFDSNLEVWGNNERIVALKKYSSNRYFTSSWVDDQIIISILLNEIPAKFKNNLYFLLVLDWDSERFADIRRTINLIEKNAKVCRKYIIDSLEDFERVPFLQKTVSENTNNFNYEQEFRKKLCISESGMSTKMINLIDGYFNMDDDKDNSSETKKIVNALLVRGGVN